jgi:hypothetical protein
VSTGTWNHGCAVFASTTSRTVYLNGTAATTDTTAIAEGANTLLTIGTRYAASTKIDWFPGSIGEVGYWNVALTQDEITALSKGVSPRFIRPQSLIDHIPLIGRDSPEIGTKGGSYALTGTSNADHPRIFYPNSPVHVGKGTSGSPPPSSNIKTIKGVTQANTKTIQGVAIASVKTYNGITNV